MATHSAATAAGSECAGADRGCLDRRAAALPPTGSGGRGGGRNRGASLWWPLTRASCRAAVLLEVDVELGAGGGCCSCSSARPGRCSSARVRTGGGEASQIGGRHRGALLSCSRLRVLEVAPV